MNNINDLNKEITHLKRQLSELRNYTIILENEKENLKVRNEYANTQINILKKEKENLNKEIEKLKNEIDILKNNFNAETLKIEELYVENELLKKELKQSQHFYENEKQKIESELNGKIEQLEKQIEIEKNKLQEKYQKEIKEYQNKLSVLENSIQSVTNSIHQEYLIRLNQLNEEHQKTIKEYQSTIERIKEEGEQKFIQLKLEKETHEEQIKHQFQNIIEQLEQQLDKKEKEIQAKYEVKIQDLEKTILENNQNLETIKSESENLQKIISEKNKEYTQLETIKKNLEQKIEHYLSLQTISEEKINALTESLHEKDEIIKEYTELIEYEKNTNSTLTTENQLLQSQVDILLSKVEHLEKNMVAKSLDASMYVEKKIYEELTQQLQKFTEENQLLHSTIQKQEQQIHSLQKEVEQHLQEQNTYYQIAPKLEKLETEKKSYVEELQKILNEKNALSEEQNLLKNEIQSLKNRLQELEETESINQTLEEQVIHLQSILDTIKTEQKEYKEKTQTMYDELLQEYHILLTENERLQSDLENAHQQIQILQDELAETHTKQNDRIEEYKCIISENQQQLEHFQKINDYLKNEILNLLDTQDILIGSLNKIQETLKNIYIPENPEINITNLDADRKNTIFAQQNHDLLLTSVNELNTQLNKIFNEKLS